MGLETLKDRNKRDGGKESENGAGDEIRTRDINLGKVALYQLSYSRTGARRLHLQTPNFQYR